VIQKKVENFLLNSQRDVILRCHKYVLRYFDEWADLSIEQIYENDRRVFFELNEQTKERSSHPLPEEPEEGKEQEEEETE